MTDAVNVTHHINERPWSRVLIAVLFCCGFVNLLDGLDTQSIGVAAPLMAEALGMRMADFGPIFSAALLGAAIGAASFGFFADRWGRKAMLMVAAALIGTFTIMTAFATTAPALIACRFFAGLGLGGATPCMLAITSEYAPARSRPLAVTLMWAAFPLGGMLGGLINSFVIVEFGWRAIFYIGGVLPFFAMFLVYFVMPESIKFLIVTRDDQEAARGIFARLGGRASALARLVLDEEKVGGASVRRLFSEGHLTGTLLLWGVFFIGYGILIVVVLWTPALLRMNGISPAATAFVVSMNGFGAIFANPLAGRLIQSWGVNPVMIPAFLLGAAATVGLGFAASSVGMAALFMALIGFFIGGATAGALALSSIIYPTAVRSTGIGWAMSAGRFGQVFGPLLAGALLGASWNASGIMLVFAGAAVVAALLTAFFMVWATRRIAPEDEAVPGAAARNAVIVAQ